MAKPTGIVYLCANALIDNSYSSTIDFKNPSEQRAYWGNLVKFSISDFMYIRRTQQAIKVNKSLNELNDVNYIFFKAEEDGKLYYCFVTSKEYINDNNTYVYFETDVLQSYMFDYEVKQSFVEQEHVNRWDSNHKPIFSLTDEGLNYGSEYLTESAYRIVPSAGEDIDWYLVVLKPGFASGDDISVSGESDTNLTIIPNVCNPFTFLLIPGSANSQLFYWNDPNSSGDPVMTMNIIEFSKIMAESSVGNYVQQIVRLPYLPFKYQLQKNDSETFNIVMPYNVGITTLSTVKDGVTIWGTFFRLKIVDDSVIRDYLAEIDLYEGIEGALPSTEQWEKVKQNPYNTPRSTVFESKLLCYPYRYNVLTDWKNQPIIVKNEYVKGDKIRVDFIQAIGFNAPARYWLENYRNDPEGRQNCITQLAQEDVPIVNDQYYTYMLQNRNQLQADRTNALVGIAGATLGAGVSGAIAGGSAGGPGGALVGGITSAVGTAFNGAINYSQLIRNQNAKQSDIKNLPDNIVSTNDTGFTIQDGNTSLSFYRKKICPEFEELLADVFATSGYTVKRVKVPNLKTRVRYNYVKTVGANIVGSFNQEDLTKIKAIFDSGITFWHYNSVNFKPYDYSLENIETSLI